MKTLRRILFFVLLLLLLCVLGVLFTPLDPRGSTGKGDYSDIVGFGNYGVPPRGGSCGNVGVIYDNNPFSGWPVNFRECDWAIISAYFCTPYYFAGYTHWGIDLASFWSRDGGGDNIHGAEIIVTTALGKVIQSAWFVPPHHNYGMGNFVKIEAWRPAETPPIMECSGDPLTDIANDVFTFCWRERNDAPPSVCSGIPEIDSQNGVFDDCWVEKPQCSGDPHTDYDNGVIEECWQPTGWIATYMHMLDVTVSEDDWVFRDDVIGHVDNTGNSTGSHLHYQINAPSWMNVGAIDPAPSFKCPGYDWNAGVEEGR